MPETEYQWSDRKRTLFGLPWSFTKYMVTVEKLLIRTGVFSIREEEVRLYLHYGFDIEAVLWTADFWSGNNSLLFSG